MPASSDPASAGGSTARPAGPGHRLSDTARLAALDSLAAAAEDAFLIADDRGVIVAWNPAAEAMFGYAAAELLGRPTADLVPRRLRGAHATGVAGFDPRARERITGRPIELTGLRRDGTEFPCEIAASTWTADGSRYYGAIVRDVSQRQRLQAQLMASQKTEALANIASGVAHDLGNSVAVIVGFADLVQDSSASDEAQAEAVREIRKAARSASSLVRQLLAFARKHSRTPIPLPVDDTLRGLERMLRKVAGDRVTFDLGCGAPQAIVVVDPLELEQVLINLVANARDAMPTGGRLFLESQQTGASVEIRIADTGTGIPVELRERVFEPFFTTKPDGRGTGLGLATSRAILEQCGGSLTLLATAGSGTTFRVGLPCSATAPARRRPQSGGIAPAGGTEVILVVDDDDAVRGMAARVLRRLGYAVLEAGGPGDALLQAEQFVDQVDLVLADVVMPLMDGRELAARVVGLHPGARVLYMTGKLEDGAARRVRAEEPWRLMYKPFDPDQLAVRVREALDGLDGGCVAG